MNETLLTTAQLGRWIEKHRVRLGIAEHAVTDVVTRLLETRVIRPTERDEPVTVAGGNLDDLVHVLRQQAPHLFTHPQPERREPSPDLSKMTAAQRLEHANTPSNSPPEGDRR